MMDVGGLRWKHACVSLLVSLFWNFVGLVPLRALSGLFFGPYFDGVCEIVLSLVSSSCEQFYCSRM